MAIKGGNFLPHYSTKSTREEERQRLVDVKMNKDDQNRARAANVKTSTLLTNDLLIILEDIIDILTFFCFKGVVLVLLLVVQR